MKCIVHANCLIHALIISKDDTFKALNLGTLGLHLVKCEFAERNHCIFALDVCHSNDQTAIHLSRKIWHAVVTTGVLASQIINNQQGVQNNVKKAPSPALLFSLWRANVENVSLAQGDNSKSHVNDATILWKSKSSIGVLTWRRLFLLKINWG